jgi:Zn-dependent protease with chaperone function
MTSAMPTKFAYTGISGKAFEHPADRAATAALKQIPFLDVAIKKLIEFGYERSYRQFFLANSVKIGPDQLPHTWMLFEDAMEVLDIGPYRPDLYVFQNPTRNAFTLGADRPIVVLQSGLVSMLSDRELQSVMAHELGHILSEHVMYKTALNILLQIGNSAVGLGALPLTALRLALLEWDRASELTCDRCATLMVRDPMVYSSTLMKLAGGGVLENLNLNAFIKQAEMYEESEDYADKSLRFLLEIGTTHPFPVRRVSELLRWVRSGNYDRILRGDYIRRGYEPPMDKEFERMVDHYSRTFNDLLGSAGKGLKGFSKDLADWLDRQNDQVNQRRRQQEGDS